MAANISGIDRHIGNRVDQLRSLVCSAEKNGELWSTNKNDIGAHVNPPKLNTACAFNIDQRTCMPRDVATREISTL